MAFCLLLLPCKPHTVLPPLLQLLAVAVAVAIAIAIAVAVAVAVATVSFGAAALS